MTFGNIGNTLRNGKKGPEPSTPKDLSRVNGPWIISTESPRKTPRKAPSETPRDTGRQCPKHSRGDVTLAADRAVR